MLKLYFVETVRLFESETIRWSRSDGAWEAYVYERFSMKCCTWVLVKVMKHYPYFCVCVYGMCMVVRRCFHVVESNAWFSCQSSVNFIVSMSHPWLSLASSVNTFFNAQKSVNFCSPVHRNGGIRIAMDKIRSTFRISDVVVVCPQIYFLLVPTATLCRRGPRLRDRGR